MKQSKREILTIPNILSSTRIILIPFFIYLYLTASDTRGYYLAAFIILLSGLTDLLDGFIARKFNQITELGKILDPIADKLTQAAIVISLMLHYPYVWILVILFFFKELYMGINGLILFKKGKKIDGAQWYGKISTAVFYMATGILIAFPHINTVSTYILLTTTAFFLLISLMMYSVEYVKLYRS